MKTESKDINISTMNLVNSTSAENEAKPCGIDHLYGSITSIAASSDSGDKELAILYAALETAFSLLSNNTDSLVCISKAVRDVIGDDADNETYVDCSADINLLDNIIESNQLSEIGPDSKFKSHADYLKSFNLCPLLSCGSTNIDGGSIEINGNTAHQEVSCNVCDSQWCDLYTLTKFEAIKPPTSTQA